MEQNKKIKTIIIILVLLLVISATGLTATLLYNCFVLNEPASVKVPGNIITPDSEDSSAAKADSPSGEPQGGETSNNPNSSGTAVVSESVPERTDSEMTGTTLASGTKARAIVLHNRKSADNMPFQVTNMFPGDADIKYYCVKVSYKGDIVVRYHADVRLGYEKLAEVLKVKIRLLETDETLYDGLMRDMPKSLNHALYTNTKTQSELYYEITAYLDTNVGNDYQDKELIADFRWWVEETDHLESPQTGNKWNIYLWICLVFGSLLLFLILHAKRRKEEADGVE